MNPYRLNSRQLAAYMIRDPYIRPYYGGVLAIDELQYLVLEPKIYVVNTDPRSESGEHWFCIFLKDIPEHFDSSGFKPKPNVENYLFFHGPDYMYNNVRVQSYTSETCGLFALFFCYFRCRGFSFLEIMNMFSPNLYVNEAVVKYFYEQTK